MIKLRRDKDLLFKALGNKTRLKILDVLVKNRGEEFSTYRISKLSKVKGDAVRKSLPILTEAGLVIEKRYGASKLYAINLKEPVTELLIEFLSKL